MKEGEHLWRLREEIREMTVLQYFIWLLQNIELVGLGHSAGAAGYCDADYTADTRV